MSKSRERVDEEHQDEGHAPAAPREGRIRVAMIAIFGGIMAFGVFGGFSQLTKTGTSDPYDAMPKAAFIAATVDFAELRRSPIFETVFGKGAAGEGAMRHTLGVNTLADACGFDPTVRVQKIAVSVPEEGDRGEFGVAARVEVTRDELEKCTKSLAEKRGGHAETRDVGTFIVLEDKSIGGAAAPRLAYGTGGLLVVGKGTWFDAMLGAADHRVPGVRDAPEHVALRTSLTSHDGFHSPTVLITALLPRSLRERLKGEMGAELGASDLSNAAMAGVLGVSAVGVALRAGAAGQNVDASVELVCDSAEACEAVDKLLKKKRQEWSGDLALRMVGFGPLLDSLAIKRDGTHLRATITAQGDALAATIDRVLRLRARRATGPAEAAPAAREREAGAKPDMKPDEAIPARPDAGGPRP